jgi:hypothetical protein
MTPLARTAWVKIPDRLPSTPKSRRAGLGAMGLHVLAMCVCRVNLSDGVVMPHDLRYIGASPTGREVKRLVEVGLWEPIDRGWLIRDYLATNESREQVERRSAVNAANGAKRRKRAAQDAPTEPDEAAVAAEDDLEWLGG